MINNNPDIKQKASRDRKKGTRNWLGAAGIVVILLALAWVARSYIDTQAQVNKWTVQRPNKPQTKKYMCPNVGIITLIH